MLMSVSGGLVLMGPVGTSLTATSKFNSYNYCSTNHWRLL